MQHSAAFFSVRHDCGNLTGIATAREMVMRLIIEARIVDGDDDTSRADNAVLAVIERPDHSLSQLGLTLSEGRSLLAEVQRALVMQQVDSWLAGQMHCRFCAAALQHKESRARVVRTVYGKVTVPSPRLWSCNCHGAPKRTFSPLSEALPEHTTPELNYLQVKWAAHLPFRAATDLLKELLPLDQGISFSGTRNRIHVVGKLLDAEIERDIARQVVTEPSDSESEHVGAVSVDSAWLRHTDSIRGLGRHVNLVVGRATFVDGEPRVYAYVHKEVASAAARLDQFLSRCGVAPNQRVTVISDDAGEFSKAVKGSQLARGRILDWFHIAMKFQAALNSISGEKTIDSLGHESMERDIRGAKWLVWHGKGSKAVARIKALDDRLLCRDGYEFSRLWWNLRTVSCYIRNNTDSLVNYGARYRKGLPISSSIAESAVNLVVSQRMAKKRQMRWTDEGAHCLAQVRVAVLNGELSPGRLQTLIATRPTSVASRQSCANGSTFEQQG
ncbi:ISKra4 family transposase [Janthinobacterium sp. HH100]|uniref:ISKra4 family transposase n=2 Tax=Janthinobacterium TaxID=29580 RepID=UPI001113205E|nr:ISKra4 family transposase [Janthinobacterium sp. HH100]